MPNPFTEEEQAAIRRKLREAARRLVRARCVRKITVGQLAASAGISTGAFYKFYPSKEHLFYELLRELHGQLYGPAMELLLSDARLSPAEKLCRAIAASCEALEQSGMVRFWMEDAPALLEHIPEQDRADQRLAEEGLYHRFLVQNGTLRVPETLAREALGSLVQTVSMRGALGADYETILLWMAEGICRQIFE